MEDEDEEVERDRLSSELTMFDRQQRRGGVAGLLEVVGGGTYGRWVGAVLVSQNPRQTLRKKAGWREKLRAKDFVCIKTAGGGA